ncbi:MULTISPECIES: hypothetical protein [Burkholderiaceae]|uniref:hypothetical protein n=1 Tax=Burkholderiaceae TaxID=119060 RepID=UPI00111574F9|nr:hypothetical protein [Burkholderia sp. b14]
MYVALANQINPNEASGVFPVAICALTDFEDAKVLRSTIADVNDGVISRLPRGAEAKTKQP